MEEKNPYYLHEENEMNVFNTQSANDLNQQRLRQQDQFARENSLNNKQLNQHSQYPPVIYQPPSFQPPSYQPPYPPISYANPSYASYQPIQANQYGNNYNPPSSSSSIDSRSLLSYDHCPFCNEMTHSFVQEKLTWIAWITCFLLFCFTVVLFWLPLCFSSCKERHIKCVKCHGLKYVLRNSC